MARFIITGGSGFIGTHIVKRLIDDGHDVLNIDIATPKVKEDEKYWLKLDICDASKLKDQVQAFNPEFVIHLGARTDLNGKTLEDYAANIDGVTNLLDALEGLSGLKKVIFTSSMYVCEPGYQPTDFDDYAPHTVYGESKVLTEKLIKERDPTYTWSIVRPTSIWGPYFGEPYNLFFKIVLSRKYFHFGDRACKKTYGYIDNFVYQIFAILDADDALINKKVFYLGDYDPYDISEWASEIAEVQGIKVPTVPFFVLRLAAWTGDALKLAGMRFPMTSFRLKNMTTDNIHNLELIKVLAPNLPVDRKTGTRRTIEWIQL
jgi:nucleoside-diphosphate-sugar epimerase